jgi:hypothetical protein
MMTLYPEIKPYKAHRVPVEAPHNLYVEESGNALGIPVLFVHGGPGAGYFLIPNTIESFCLTSAVLVYRLPMPS